MKLGDKIRAVLPWAVCLLALSTGVIFIQHFSTDSPVTESKYFDITVLPVEIVPDGDLHRLHYQLMIKNKSEISFENLQISLQLEKPLLPYLASGTLSAQLGEYDLVPEEMAKGSVNQAYGVNCAYSPSLVEEETLLREGLSYADCLKTCQEVTLLLKWKGGNETLQLPATAGSASP